MTQARQILQLQIESGRIAQLRNRRRIQRKNNGILDRGEFSRRARDDPLNRMLGAFSFTPIFEPSERKRRVLSATVETKSRDCDEALDFGLFQKILYDLAQNFIRPLLRRPNRQLDVGDEITLIFGGQK